jgi:hypothetical protein
VFGHLRKRGSFEDYLLAMAEASQRAGTRLHIVARLLVEPTVGAALEDRGVTVQCVSDEDLNSQSFFARTVARLRPGLVHCHFGSPSTSLALISKMLLVKRFVTRRGRKLGRQGQHGRRTFGGPVRLAFAFAFLLLFGAASPGAENWTPENGRTPVDIRPADPLAVHPGDTLVIRGVVSGEGPASVTLRIDDGKSGDYASRVNEERLLPPGPFTWHFPIAGAKTPGGRVLDANDVRRLMLFEPKGQARIAVEGVALEAGPKLPDGVAGFSLGASDAPLIGGLERLAPGDTRLAGHAVAIRRPGPDPVVGNGIAGIERLRLAWPKGRAHVSLWIEDVGEWENLPHPLQRRVRVNGFDVVYVNPTPQQWVDERYLAGRDREAGPNDDAWTAYGRYRGGLVSADVDVGDDGLTIELAGDGAPSTYLSAVVIEPEGRTTAVAAVDAARRQWMVENFPVLPTPKAPSVPTFGSGVASSPGPIEVTLARGTGGRLAFAVQGSSVDEYPKIAIAAPALDGAKLDLGLYASQQRLERTSTDSSLLERTGDFMRGEPESLPIRPGEPRSYLAWASAPTDAAPGSYHGSIAFELKGRTIVVPLVVKVLPVTLPEARSPAGFYLDEAPHLLWFDEMRGDRARQLGCDLATLRGFGVLGDAPGLATPDGASVNQFVDDARLARDLGVAEPWLAYAPLKRLIASGGVDAAAAEVQRASERLSKDGLPSPVWALFDEPGNFGGGDQGAVAAAAKLRAAVPGVKLAGQFNNPSDRSYLPAIDVAVVNPGFGVDAATIASLGAAGHEVWLYNTGAPRFTAGVWLWRTHASRYLQWHARMPTADPFDPTDGREGDVQVFPPMPQVCGSRQDIDVKLVEMAEGLVDQRWLQWLAQRSEPQARALAARIDRDTLPDWASAAANGARKSEAIREEIVNVAQSLK